ncbi:carbohydrate-binding family 9-like protein [uncultured Polaribacter sp.]|uniref:carbohydrate-binding family 9-like protein n=1 Tax=uncultured Polaribacter sp. TaxID=174711 RepID=UPI002625C5F2|nr:carbohydrate-binding family 9-like protein [uncultured Polaribacter sp.]
MIFFTILFSCKKQSLNLETSFFKDLVTPKTYVVYKTDKPLTIDGIDDEDIWKNTKYTSNFIDIEGIKTPKQVTKVKMLWDDEYLYIYAKLFEEHIWADITERDQVIFLNNDFEVFINPSNDVYNYGEIEINALETVWDLLLDKPYSLGGKPKNEWNLEELKAKVFIEGTLNNAKDIDTFWSVEMAIPLKSFVALKNLPRAKIKDGEQWRINFSRVNWDFDLINNTYARKKRDNKYLPEYNWVWSNQGEINMHLPEKWGYIQFSKNTPKNAIQFKHKTDVLTEQIIYTLFRSILYKDLQYLKNKKVGTITVFEPIKIENKIINVTFLKTFSGFNLKVTTENSTYTINESGFLKKDQ